MPFAVDYNSWLIETKLCIENCTDEPTAHGLPGEPPPGVAHVCWSRASLSTSVRHKCMRELPLYWVGGMGEGACSPWRAPSFSWNKAAFLPGKSGAKATFHAQYCWILSFAFSLLKSEEFFCVGSTAKPPHPTGSHASHTPVPRNAAGFGFLLVVDRREPERLQASGWSHASMS